MSANSQLKPRTFLIAAALSAVIFWMGTHAEANQPGVEAFLGSVKSEAPMVGDILTDYNTYITNACHQAPSVDDLKRFAQHSPYYVDMLGYKSLFVDNAMYRNALQAIDCTHFKTLRFFPVKATRL